MGSIAKPLDGLIARHYYTYTMQNGMMNRTLKPLSLPEAEQAAKVLGLELADVNTETLRGAFRDRMREIHPDASVAAGDNASEEIQKAYQARAKLLLWVSMQPKKGCTVCGGRGWVRSGPFGSQVCSAC